MSRRITVSLTWSQGELIEETMIAQMLDHDDARTRRLSEGVLLALSLAGMGSILLAEDAQRKKRDSTSRKA
jgi:hypothetical protein